MAPKGHALRLLLLLNGHRLIQEIVIQLVQKPEASGMYAGIDRVSVIGWQGLVVAAMWPKLGQSLNRMLDRLTGLDPVTDMLISRHTVAVYDRFNDCHVSFPLWHECQIRGSKASCLASSSMHLVFKIV